MKSTGWARSLHVRTNLLDNTHCCSYKHVWVNLSLWTVLHLLRVQFVTSRTPNLCTPLNITAGQKITQSNSINSHAQVTTAFFFFNHCTVHFYICGVHSPPNAHFYFKKHIEVNMKIHIKKYRCYMFRPSTIIRELALNLTKVMFMLLLYLCCVAACCHTTA